MKLAIIEVAGSDVDDRSGIKDGRPWEIRTQKAYLHQDEPYPIPFDLRLEKGQLAYPPGRYLFAAGSFVLFKGDLQLSRRVNLIPIEKVPDLLGSRSSSRAAA